MKYNHLRRFLALLMLCAVVLAQLPERKKA